MAVVVRHKNGHRVEQSGARGLRESLLAGPASGCNRFTVRNLTLAPDGRTAPGSFTTPVFYYMNEGKAVLTGESGEMDTLSHGDSAVVQADERHSLMNISEKRCSILRVVAQ